MNNAEIFAQTFGIYATEMWAMPESEFLNWLNSLHDVNATNTTDTISRETVKEWLNNIGVYGYDWQVDELPSAERKGKWKYVKHYGDRYRVCPFCQAERRDDLSTGWNYCPNCGAKLEGEEE